MVDFRKRLSGAAAANPVNPVELYETLDRAVDKGPLRPAQNAVLNEWFDQRRSKKDVIVKLHTGQGKTLIGLLMLQSRLNSGSGPAVYLCPNNFLIAQTCEQAKQFGIKTCVADPDLPDDFANSKAILVTSIQKLFNGMTRFGINRDSTEVGTLLMDDAHACADAIRAQCRIRIPRDDPAYQSVKALFETDLENQGVGTYADIVNEKREAFLPVPYWSWIERESEVAKILSAASSRATVKYSWPLLKNILSKCQCIISGSAIEIEPHIAPLEVFGTYWKAPHRVFMSATVTDDAFLVKGLQLSPETITNPLTYDLESWSGEKMILLPSVMDSTLGRGTMVQWLAKPSVGRKMGVVALVPSFNASRDWESYGANVAKADTVDAVVENLKAGKAEKCVVLVNRYDGIDLADDACRVLVFDATPYSESLIDLYQESCRPDSEVIVMRTIRTIEQGMGRSVRGEKDYSVIIVIGTDLIRLLRERKSSKFLSSQMAKQIEIGLEVAELGAEDISGGATPLEALSGLINQCLRRDPSWKAFYTEKMDSTSPKPMNDRILKSYVAELQAELAFNRGSYQDAADILQKSLDSGVIDRADTGWYLQDMARYLYKSNRIESTRLQIEAHKSNRLLLLPSAGVTVAKLTVVSHNRVERLISWVKKFGNYHELDVSLSDICSRLSFGVKADKFEQALHELSEALGFAGERPDKEWKEGPDNLWALDDTHYILWECKNEVELERAEINKKEAEQINRSYAWFKKHYVGMYVKNILIHPSNVVASSANFLQEVEVMRATELKKFIKRIQAFYKSFESQDFSSLSAIHVQQLIDQHTLGAAIVFDDLVKHARHAK